jgi:hypothetical protein
MRRLAYLIPGFVLLGLVTFTPGTQAESECDGETGAALGLCKTYCEALECDTAAPIGSLKACERILSTSLQVTGTLPPCRIYITRDPTVCSSIRFSCELGYTPFFDDASGCGCEPE